MITAESRSQPLITDIANPDSERSQEVSRIGNRIVSNLTHINDDVIIREIFSRLSDSHLLMLRKTSKTFRKLLDDMPTRAFLLRNQLECKGKICSSDFAKLERYKKLTGGEFKSYKIIDLNLCISNITNEQLEGLIKRFPNLQSLNLNDCQQITDAGLVHLRALTNLQSLNLSWCQQITDEGLVHLTALRNLQSLDLSLCRQITDAGLVHLRALRNLQSLNLGWRPQITDAGLVHLRALTNLQSLDLSRCWEITDAGLVHLRDLPNLQTLNLNRCRQITNEGLDHLRALTNLQSLCLSACQEITDAGLAHLTVLTNLQSLNLWDCRQTTNAGFATFLERGVQITHF